MVAKVRTFAFNGVGVTDVDVEVKLSSGMFAFNMVGLPDKAVGESKERVRAAISSIGLSLPPGRITVNLAPADIAKEGSHFDLAIALGILVEMSILSQDDVSEYIVLGELSLDGGIATINGTLPAAVGASARNMSIICPKKCGKEAAWAGEDLNIVAPDNLLSLINHFKGTQVLSRPEVDIEDEHCVQYPDLSDVKGQSVAKRALEIAAAGGHNMLMIGPPGAGKSMLASRLPGILPKPDVNEMLEINMMASITGQIADGKLIRHRPYRDPHHSCSIPAMVGGGSKAKPGEISLAHNGVLFMDELAEFPPTVLDSLRQPIETGNITISRVHAHVTFPANFQFIAAMNPCKCGHMMDETRACKRAPHCGREYMSKISGPLLDRIDLYVEIPPVDIFSIDHEKSEESSRIVAQRVKMVRNIQQERYANIKSKTNSRADGEALEDCTKLDETCKNTLKKAVEKLGLSMRGYNRILRVARTIADMECAENINKHHLSEAIGYRKSYA